MTIDDYENWLIASVADSNGSHDVLKILFDIEYSPILADDANRLADAYELQKEFGINRPIVSILEVLISFSRRVAFLFDVIPMDESEWFWFMMDNMMNLSHFADETQLSDEDLGIIRDICERFSQGKIDVFGLSVFADRPLSLWESMNRYGRNKLI